MSSARAPAWVSILPRRHHRQYRDGERRQFRGLRYQGVQDLVINLGSAGDDVVVTGSLDGTGLATHTITINGGAGNDTVDLSKFTSGQDVVYNGAGNGPAGDTVIFGFASSAATYAPIFDGNGGLIGADVTYTAADGHQCHRRHYQCRAL